MQERLARPRRCTVQRAKYTARIRHRRIVTMRIAMPRSSATMGRLARQNRSRETAQRVLLWCAYLCIISDSPASVLCYTRGFCLSFLMIMEFVAAFSVALLMRYIAVRGK